MSSQDEKDSERFWKHQNEMWAKDRHSGGGGHMASHGFVARSYPTASGWVMVGSKEDQQRKQQEKHMAYEYKEGQGSLFINNKDGVESRPDRTGKAMIGGKMYRISGWIKESTNGGNPFLSLSIQEDKPKEAAETSPKPADENPF